MNLFTGESADEFFGGAVPPTVHRLLHEAAQVPRGEVAALLWTAQALAPTCLPIYYALYKHHAGLREFEQAERSAQRGLLEAAHQAGLNWIGVVLPVGKLTCMQMRGLAKIARDFGEGAIQFDERVAIAHAAQTTWCGVPPLCCST